MPMGASIAVLCKLGRAFSTCIRLEAAYLNLILINSNVVIVTCLGAGNRLHCLHLSTQSIVCLFNILSSNIVFIQSNLCINQCLLKLCPVFRLIVGLIVVCFCLFNQIYQHIFVHSFFYQLDGYVIQNKVLIAAKVSSCLFCALQVRSIGSGVDTKPCLARSSTYNLKGIGLFLLAAHCHWQFGYLLAAGYFAIAYNYAIDSIGTCLVVKAYFVLFAGLKTEVLRNGLHNQIASLAQAIDLNRPVGVGIVLGQNVVHLLYIPASLSIGSVQLRQVGAVILNALNAAYNKGIQALYRVFKVLVQTNNIAGFVFLNNIHLGFQYTDIIEVYAALACFFGQGQGNSAGLRCGEVYIHVLEVAASVHSCAGVAVGVCLYIVFSDRTLGIVAIQNSSIYLNAHSCLGIAAVVYTNIDGVGFAGNKVGDGLGHSNFTIQFQHGVAVLALCNGCLAVALVGPVFLQSSFACVEAYINKVHSLAPCYLQVGFLALQHDIGSLCLGSQGDFAAGNSNGLQLGFAQIGELVYLNIGKIFPAIGQFPSGFAAQSIPVVQFLLRSLYTVAGLRIPNPRNQVAFGTAFASIATGNCALCNYLTIQGYSSVAVCGAVDVGAFTLGNNYIGFSSGLVGVCFQGDFLFGGPCVAFAVVGHLHRSTILPVYYLIVLEEFGH